MPHAKNTAMTVCGQQASSAKIDWCEDCFLTTLKMTAKLGIAPDNLSVLDSLTPLSNPYLAALIDALDLKAAVQHEQEQERDHNGNHICLLLRKFVETVVKYADAVKLYEIDNMGIRRWPGDIAHPERLTTSREVAAWLEERDLPPEMPPMRYWSFLRLSTRPLLSPPQPQSQSPLGQLQKQQQAIVPPKGGPALALSSSPVLPPALLLATPQTPLHPRQENRFASYSHSYSHPHTIGAVPKVKANNTAYENMIISPSSPLSASSQQAMFRRLPSLVSSTRQLHISDPPTPATPSSTRRLALVPPLSSPTPPNSSPSPSFSSTNPLLLSPQTYRQSLHAHPQGRPNPVPSAAASARAPAASRPISSSSSSSLPPRSAEPKQQQAVTPQEREQEYHFQFQSSVSPSEFSFVPFGEASERYFANPTPENQAEYDRLCNLLNCEVRRRMGDKEGARRRGNLDWN